MPFCTNVWRVKTIDELEKPDKRSWNSWKAVIRNAVNYTRLYRGIVTWLVRNDFFLKIQRLALSYVFQKMKQFLFSSYIVYCGRRRKLQWFANSGGIEQNSSTIIWNPALFFNYDIRASLVFSSRGSSRPLRQRILNSGLNWPDCSSSKLRSCWAEGTGAERWLAAQLIRSADAYASVSEEPFFSPVTSVAYRSAAATVSRASCDLTCSDSRRRSKDYWMINATFITIIHRINGIIVRNSQRQTNSVIDIHLLRLNLGGGLKSHPIYRINLERPCSGQLSLLSSVRIITTTSLPNVRYGAQCSWLGDVMSACCAADLLSASTGNGWL